METSGSFAAPVESYAFVCMFPVCIIVKSNTRPRSPAAALCCAAVSFQHPPGPRCAIQAAAAAAAAAQKTTDTSPLLVTQRSLGEQHHSGAFGKICLALIEIKKYIFIREVFDVITSGIVGCLTIVL